MQRPPTPMIDTNTGCPTVPDPYRGTVGQSGYGRDSARDSNGTSRLKWLAAKVLARDGTRDSCGTPAPNPCPTCPAAVLPVLGHVPPVLAAVSGVPADWCEGVALLATMTAPDDIPPPRWATLAGSSARLLRNHGAELHEGGWDVLDLFGLHSVAPLSNPTGWGLAWLLGSTGRVLDVSAEAIGMCRDPGGTRMTFRRRERVERAGTVPAWKLRPVGQSANFLQLKGTTL